MISQFLLTESLQSLLQSWLTYLDRVHVLQNVKLKNVQCGCLLISLLASA